MLTRLYDLLSSWKLAVLLTVAAIAGMSPFVLLSGRACWEKALPQSGGSWRGGGKNFKGVE